MTFQMHYVFCASQLVQCNRMSFGVLFVIKVVRLRIGLSSSILRNFPKRKLKNGPAYGKVMKLSDKLSSGKCFDFIKLFIAKCRRARQHQAMKAYMLQTYFVFHLFAARKTLQIQAASSISRLRLEYV